jgi:hypothetical protein
MIDRGLAELYGIETRTLNQAVKRNLKRFPKGFMFQRDVEESENWKSQIVISNSERMSMCKAFSGGVTERLFTMIVFYFIHLN